MAIVVEDGSGSNPLANSYITVAEAQAYATARGYTLPTAVEPLLIQAMDYFRTLNWAGQRTSEAQPLAWPRTGICGVADNEIPQSLKDAQARLALNIANGTNPAPTTNPNVGALVAEKEGDLAHEFAEPSKAASWSNVPNMPVVTALLRPFLARWATLRSIRV